MLGTRLKTGIAMAVALAVVLALDEWTAPWFWLWLVLAVVVTGLSSLELVGLLDQTSTRPSTSARQEAGRDRSRGRPSAHRLR